MFILLADQHMYGILNNRLLRKPFLDIHDANVIVELLNNHSLQEESRKLWVLNMVKNGLRSSADYYIYKRSRVFEQLMCLYDLSLCDDTIKVCYLIWFDFILNSLRHGGHVNRRIDLQWAVLILTIIDLKIKYSNKIWKWNDLIYNTS